MSASKRAPSMEAALTGAATTHIHAPNGMTSVSGPERVIEIQRSRILTAMVEVVCERGAGNVTVAHVVQRAGVSRRTFYELFADREECFLAAFQDAFSRATRYVLDSYDPNARWAERIRTALTRLLSFLDVERDRGRLLIIGSLGAGAGALEQRQRVLTELIVAIDEGRRESNAGSYLPALTAEGIVGGVMSILHSRLLEDQSKETGEPKLLVLTGPLMSMIVLPYLGPTMARRELTQPIPRPVRAPTAVVPDPLRDLGIRLTYRTVRVLTAVAAHPGASNRQVADGAGITDQGQISKLLGRLQGLGLIENTDADSARGAPNSWILTDKGWLVQAALAHDTT